MRCSRTGRKMNKLLQQLNPGRAFNGLWRHGDFVRLWSSLTITHYGGQITFLALPLTGALLLDATPLEMGVLTALEALPFALFGLFFSSRRRHTRFDCVSSSDVCSSD